MGNTWMMEALDDEKQPTTEPAKGETDIVRLVEYLEESLIPDLEESGLNETACDFRMAVEAIRELQEMVRKLREV